MHNSSEFHRTFFPFALPTLALWALNSRYKQQTLGETMYIWQESREKGRLTPRPACLWVAL